MTYGATTTPPREWSPDLPWVTWWERAEEDRDTRHGVALLQLAAVAAGRGAGVLDGWSTDSQIRRVADLRADLLRRELETFTTPQDSGQMADWLNARVVDLGARPFTWPGCDKGKPPPAGALAPMVERAQCPLWWRRQLRRYVVRAREHIGMQRGEVCARRGQVYCTTDTVERRRERQASNRAMLEATEIENAAGQVITLAQAAEASTANKGIRRGELMTRIRGCEEWADGAGMVGVFTTNTCPSRFHPQTMHGGANPKHDGSTPRDGQLWLRNTWAKCRAKLDRAGVRWFGFRVAEPHHDGCPHWHMLLWCEPAQLQQLQDIIRAAWLADEPAEPGAQEHRFKAKPLTPGGAAAYCAKYISKNIDDEGAVSTEGHRDEDHAGQSDWVGTGKAQRVEAWASAHGIRQFQALGQPPVTVWRELRRVDGQMVCGAHPDIAAAHAAVSRDGARRACWRGYMAAQGGAMVGRGYRIRIARSEDAPTLGRYGDEQPARPVGVEHVARIGQWVVSDRKEWKPRGAWAEPVGQRHAAPIPGLGEGLKAPCPPRSRVNNCTGRGLSTGLTVRQIERFRAQHGTLRVVLAEKSEDPGAW